MERLKVHCRGACRGEAMICERDGRVEITVRMDDPADGLYRAILIGTEGEMVLGIMEAESGALTLRRRPPPRDVERLGKLSEVQAVCAFSFRKKRLWQRTDTPAELVESAFLKKRLAAVPSAWWRKEEDQLILALPLEPTRPFPLESLFCLARIGNVEGERCAIYVLNSQEIPM
mgnify:CR=1 FL=1